MYPRLAYLGTYTPTGPPAFTSEIFMKSFTSERFMDSLL